MTAPRSHYLPPSQIAAANNYETAEAARHADLVARAEAHAGDLIKHHGRGVLWPSYYVGRDKAWRV